MGFERYEDFEDEEYYEEDDRRDRPEVIRYGLDWGWDISDYDDLCEQDELDPPYGAYDNEDDGQGPYYPGGYVECFS